MKSGLGGEATIIMVLEGTAPTARGRKTEEEEALLKRTIWRQDDDVPSSGKEEEKVQEISTAVDERTA